MKHWLLILTALILGVAIAQSLSGTWVATLQNGSVITMVLQESDGQIQGTLTSNGVTLQLEGDSNGVGADGTISSQTEQAVFQLTLLSNILTLVVTEINPSTGETNQSTAQTFQFSRSNLSSSLQNPSSTVIANPNIPDPLLGRFIGKDMTLEILGSNGSYKGVITLDKQKYAITGQGGNGVLRGQFVAKGGTYLFEARVKQNSMTVLLNGKTYLLSPQVVQNPNTSKKLGSSGANNECH